MVEKNLEQTKIIENEGYRIATFTEKTIKNGIKNTTTIDLTREGYMERLIGIAT